jgi:hypothetical protein
MFVRTTSWVVVLVVLVVLVVAWLAGAGWARADGVPKPAITGTAQAGETLTASATWGTQPPTTVAWQWLRCDAEKPGTCKAVAGATADHYRIADADVG